MASSSASSSDDAIRERSDNKERNLWIHATSTANLAKIRNEGYLRAHQNNDTSKRYDSVLTDKHGPVGVWFNCHYWADGCLPKNSPYPESCKDSEVKGLVADEHDLLTGGGKHMRQKWELFCVSETPVTAGNRCVNYVCVASGSPWPSWLRERSVREVKPDYDGGRGDYVIRDQLEWTGERGVNGHSVRIELRRKERHWTWNAVPLARGKSDLRAVAVAVFLVSPFRPSPHTTLPVGALPLEWFNKKIRGLKHSSKPENAKSPGELEDWSAASPSGTPAGSSSAAAVPVAADVMHDVPALPKPFVEPAGLTAILNQLLASSGDSAEPVQSGDGDALGTPLLLVATAGIGKTTAAAWLAQQPAVHTRFPDGVYWLQFSSDGSRPAREALLILARAVLSGGEQHALTVAEAVDLLSGNNGLLKHKSALLILDDVWTAEECNPFLEISAKLPGISLLITARRTNVVQDHTATKLEMKGLPANESETLILDMTTPNPLDQQDMREEAGFGEVLAKCDGMPALLRAFGRLCNRKSCAEVLEDWAIVTQTHASLEYGSLFTAYTLQLNNLKLCDEELLACLEKLAILREDEDVSLDALEHVWPGTNVKDTVERLIAESIIEGTRWAVWGTIRLIDAWRDFLRVRAGKQKMAGWHADLLRRCGRMVGYNQALDDHFFKVIPILPRTPQFVDPERLTQGSTSAPTAHIPYFTTLKSSQGSEGGKRFVHHMLGACGAFVGSGSIEFGDLSHLEQLEVHGCSLLTEVPPEIMGGMRSLRILDMSHCESLASIKLPPTIVAFKFDGCISLREVELPDSLTHISDNSFTDCCALSSIQLPRNIRSIGSLAFYGCSSLSIVEFELPSSLQRIDSHAFCRCTALRSIELPSGLMSINNYAFSECSALTTIDLPIICKERGGFGCDLFEGCSSMSKVTLGGKDAEHQFIASLQRGDSSARMGHAHVTRL